MFGFALRLVWTGLTEIKGLENVLLIIVGAFTQKFSRLPTLVFTWWRAAPVSDRKVVILTFGIYPGSGGKTSCFIFSIFSFRFFFFFDRFLIFVFSTFESFDTFGIVVLKSILLLFDTASGVVVDVVVAVGGVGVGVGNLAACWLLVGVTDGGNTDLFVGDGPWKFDLEKSI